MKKNKNITDAPTYQELCKMLKQERKCWVEVKKNYNTQAYDSFSCYNVNTKEVFRILVVAKANDGHDDIFEYFNSKASSVKYNEKVKSCHIQAIGIEFVDIRELQKKGFIVVEVHEDGTFKEINSTELLLAYDTRFKRPINFMKRLIRFSNHSPLVHMTGYVESVLENEFNIPTYVDINAVSKTISTFMNMNTGAFGAIMRYLDKQAGNVVFRADDRILYYYLGNGVTNAFKEIYHDSADSCEFDMRENDFEGGVMEFISTICSVNKLSKAEEAYIHTIIDTMLKTPSSKLNKVFTSLVINFWQNYTTCFSDRYAIINGPTVEFVKCDKEKAGSVEDITPTL